MRVGGYEVYILGVGRVSLLQYCCLAVLGVYCAVCLCAESICQHYDPGAELPVDWNNPEYHLYPGFTKHRRELLGLSLEQADFCRRLLVAALLGAVIGTERRSSERPAGIRTMCMVALGSANLTLSSTFAFRHGPMNWDASRISAAIPSGVGFLGAGVIWKGQGDSGHEQGHKVRGLTTAACVWLSAAIGVAAGGGLYFIAVFTTAISIAILRLAPHHPVEHEHHNAYAKEGSGREQSEGPTKGPKLSKAAAGSSSSDLRSSLLAKADKS